MKTVISITLLVLVAVPLLGQGTAPQPPPQAADQAANPWAFSVTLDGYIVPHEPGYASPIFTADHNWHFEARYNYENLDTGSLWFGYDFNIGKKVKLTLTPMIGGVVGDTRGIGPGLETTVSWKKLQFYAASEYVFDTTHAAGSFFYSWPQLSYSVLSWLRLGVVAQHTKAYHTSLNTQRGFLVGVNYKEAQFTTYVFDPELSTPTVVLEVGYNF